MNSGTSRPRGSSKRKHRYRDRVIYEPLKKQPGQRKQWPVIVLIIAVTVVGMIVILWTGHRSIKEIDSAVRLSGEKINKHFNDTKMKLLSSINEIVKKSNQESIKNIQEAMYPDDFGVGLDIVNMEYERQWSDGFGEYYPPGKMDIHSLKAEQRQMMLRVRIKNESKYPANFVRVTLYISEEAFKESTIDIWGKLRRLSLVSKFMEPPPLFIEPPSGRGARIELKGCRFIFDQFENKVPESFSWFNLTLEKEIGYFGVMVRDNIFLFKIELKNG